MTIAQLRELLFYDPETGYITWRVDRSNQIKAGSRAGAISKRGYIYIEVSEKSYMSAILAWALHYGEWPSQTVDHKDRVRTNDKLDNLRLASRRENNHNQSLRRDNKVGRKGVTFDWRTNRFRATIKGPIKQIHIGMFASVEEAGAAYDAKAKELFGEFAL